MIVKQLLAFYVVYLCVYILFTMYLNLSLSGSETDNRFHDPPEDMRCT